MVITQCTNLVNSGKVHTKHNVGLTPCCLVPTGDLNTYCF